MPRHKLYRGKRMIQVLEVLNEKSNLLLTVIIKECRGHKDTKSLVKGLREEGYMDSEAFGKAQSLKATYRETMIRLEYHGLVNDDERKHRRYVITDKGKRLIQNLRNKRT